MTRNIFKVVYLVIFTILSGASLCAQNFEVDVEIKGYTNDTLIVGNYFGEKQIVKDTSTKSLASNLIENFVS